MDTTDPATTNHPTDERTTGEPPQGPPLQDLTIRTPTTADGGALWRLARDSGSLDLNSSYAYLLLARHFAATCRVAVLDDAAGGAGRGTDGGAGVEVVGFLSAYRLPDAPSTLFVWQVAVDERVRGRRVAARLLDAAVDGSPGVTRVETTVTTDNAASRRLFARWAERRGATLSETTGFEAADFPDGHEAEPLLVIDGIRGR
ncbi:diaminobutyrate acetyltransferase [Isoptericola hypogeus]